MTTGSSRGRVLLWAATVLVVVGSSLGAVTDPAGAQSTGGDGFSDDDGSVHEPALDVLAARGVLAGMECGDGLICPGEPLRRWEMAVWLVRVLDGADPGPSDVQRFSDVDYDRWWAPFVERLYELGITVGCGREPLQYCGDRAVSRAQMATFLVRAFDLGWAPSAGFADVSGGSHAENIDALAAAGVTVGCGRDPLEYCGDRSVTRAQMASFLARALGLTELPAAVRYIAVAAGLEHTCGLRADNTAVCWGGNTRGQADAPDGEYRSISAGGTHSCAVAMDGSVLCWGADDAGQSTAPDGEFTSVAAGGTHSCAVAMDGSVLCWGADDVGQSSAPDGEYRSVSTGWAHSCAVAMDGSVLCWGPDDAGQSTAPDGEFTSVGAGVRHSCGIRADATVACWGPNYHPAVTHSPSGNFSQLSVGFYHSCAVRPAGSVYCWGSSGDGQAASPGGQFSAVAASERHSCGMRLNGVVVCWGDAGDDPADAPEGEFSALSSRWKHVCGLRTDGTVACWGHQGAGRAHAADGAFAGVGAGTRHSCGVRADATVACWGDGAGGRTDPPSGQFQAVSVGQDHSCGLRIDGSVVCWGSDHAGQSDAPQGQFSTIATGSHHSCGILADGAVTCWGLDGGHLQAPDGEFTSVTAGDAHSCGLRTDGSVSCWSDFTLQAAAPSGEFVAIAAGYWHTCGIRTDSTVSCWGSNSWGQSTPPEGGFTAVAAGYSHTCGVRPDGSVVCWGAKIVGRPIGVRFVFGHAAYPDPGRCRPYGVSGVTTAGFPLPHWTAPPTGVVRVAVLFLDFPDAPAGHSTRREAEVGLPFMEEYVESASYGQVDVQVTPLHRWLRAEHGHAHYAAGGIDAEAVRLADPEFDFSGFDVVMTVMPSTHFYGGVAFGHARTEEGTIRLTTRLNFLPVPEPRAPFKWGTVAAHELLHVFGLLDLYPYDADAHRQPPEPSGEAWLEARFGVMALRGYFLARERDDRVAHVWRYPDGFRSTAYSRVSDAREELAWSRWQLGWLDGGQVRCVTESRATVSLSPVADPGEGIAMAAIPLTAHEVVVVESRRRIGLDAGVDHVEPNGVRTTFPGLATEGVLVYTVDASLSGGQLPIKLAGDSGNGRVDDYPTLSVGESVTVRGYTIEVVADDGDTHTVTITRTAG